MGFFTRILVNALLFMALAGLLANTGWIYVAGAGTAFLAAVVLAVLNALVKPLLLLLSLPINLLTLGLFSIVINGLMLQMTASFVGPTLHFASFGAAMMVALIMSVCNMVITSHFSRF